MIPYLSALPTRELEGKRVFLRLDLNVPLKDGVILDDFRITQSLPTILYLKSHGAKLTIASHLGEDGSLSIEPIRAWLAPHLGEGDLLLDNVRLHPGEMANDPQFARALAEGCDLYVNEAFSVSHRAHASVVGVTEFLPSYGGLLFEKEVAGISKLFSPEHPFVAILGGAKFATKIPLMRKLLTQADRVFVVGALCNDFFAAKGLPVGASLVGDPELARPFLDHPKIVIPTDIITSNRSVKKVEDVANDEKILDIGPESLHFMSETVSTAETVVWNGPLGRYEDGYTSATDGFAEALASSKAFSVLGGGDTLAATKKLDLLDRFGFVSTAGGAMLDYIVNETLPGIEALKK